MIGMTPRASKKMKEMLATGTATSGLRIEVQGNSCSPSYRFELVERPAQGDHWITGEGIRIYIDPSQARSFFNVEIDHDGSSDESGFTVRRSAPCG